MSWNKIWNNRKIDKNNLYDHNGYSFKSNIEYIKFIKEITSNIIIPNNSKILDIGCGNGSFTNEMLKMKNIDNTNIFGLDFCKENIKHANKNYNGTYILHDIANKLPFENNYFNVILCVSSLFYLKNLDQLDNVIKEIKRVSKKNCLIFFGNCMDEEKKDIANEIRKETHHKESKHLYINKKYFIDKFSNNYINIIDNNDLDLEFYNGRKYKYNVLINTIQKINIGVDFHDTISYYPKYFINKLLHWHGERIIITGTPYSKNLEIIKQLNNVGLYKNIHFDSIEYGYEYDKEKMDYNHFKMMKIHKLNAIKKHNIEIYFDDNPYYVDYLRNKGIIVFQTILSNKYINKFNKIDKYFCCNLQENQFNYLSSYENKKRIYIPGVFDLFHIGHLKLLKKAKNLCNSYLIVGLQNDDSVYRTKKKKPILNEKKRKEFIEELSIADKIIIYSDTNQCNKLKKHKIDIFVIGPEFGNCKEHIETLEYCNNNDIHIEKIERTKDISTTDIINTIKNS
jgi:glycerol-3-phosphate cytidylyltransferase